MQRYRRVAALLVFACVALSACRAKTPIGIGVVLDRDGLRGATLAVQDVNARGGVLGRKLELRDLGGAGTVKARVSIETAERLTADPRILAVIGHTNSSSSLAASQVYNKRGVVQLAPTSSAPLYSNAGPYSFRLVGSDVHQGLFLANQILARSPRPRVALFYVNDDYGRPLRQTVVDRLRSAGVSLVYDSPYTEGEGAEGNVDMVTGLARSRPDVLVWVGRASEFMLLHEHLKRAIPNLEVLASDGFSGRTVALDTMHVLLGVRYVRLIDGRRQSPALDEFNAAYVRQYGALPGDQAVLSYDCVALIAEAIRHAGLKREGIRDWLSQVGRAEPQFNGLSGPIAFTADGDRHPHYFLETLDSSSARAPGLVVR